MTTTHKVEHSKKANWVIVDRRKMESEFGVHVTEHSYIAMCETKGDVLKVLLNMTKRDLSFTVVSQFDVVNGKPRKYQIGVAGDLFVAENILGN